MLIFTILACAAPADAIPLNGPVPTGAWGEGSDGAGTVLTVAEDGSAHLDNGCWGGDIGALIATDGSFDVVFGYDLRNDTAGAMASTFTGTVKDDTLTASLTIDDGDPRSLTLVLGHEITLFECP